MRRSESGLGNAALSAAGTKEQVAKWGHLILSMAITEPGCGSNPSRVQMTAVLDEKTNEWVLNGEKIFVTTGCRAQGVVVWATLDRAAGRAGIKSFLIEKGTPGFVVATRRRSSVSAPTTPRPTFQDCRIRAQPARRRGIQRTPAASRVMKTNMTRPPAASPGMSQAALDFTAAAHAGRRGPVLRPGVHGLSAAAKKFQQLEALQDAALLTVLRAAWLSDQSQPNNLEASVSKAKGGTAVRQITQGCIELLGPMGISREHLLEKWLRRTSRTSTRARARSSI
jgi:acyl-CoA dehydrogenase